MLLSLVYFVVHPSAPHTGSTGAGDLELEAELLILRHQVKVLSRQRQRVSFRPRDRVDIVSLRCAKES
jgi:hypothetical protein